MLLHLLLELDVRRAPAPAPLEAVLIPEHGWLPVVNRAAPATPAPPAAAAAPDGSAAGAGSKPKEAAAIDSQKEQEGRHAATNGEHAEAAGASEDGGGGSGPCSSPAGTAEDHPASPPKGVGTKGKSNQHEAGLAQGSRRGPSGKDGAGGERTETAGDGAVPLLQCTLEDVCALTAHWDRQAPGHACVLGGHEACMLAEMSIGQGPCCLLQKGFWLQRRFPEAWRASIKASCEVLRTAITKSNVYQPGSLQQFLVRAVLRPHSCSLFSTVLLAFRGLAAGLAMLGPGKLRET